MAALLGPVDGLRRDGDVEVGHPTGQAAGRHHLRELQRAGAVASVPQEPDEVDALLPGERGELDDADDHVGRGGRGDGGGPAADRLPDDDGRPAEVADDGDEVTGDVRALVRRPRGAGVAAAADVHVRDPVAGGDELRDDEPVRVAAVAHAVCEDHEGADAGDVHGDGPVGGGDVFEHDGLLAAEWLMPIAISYDH
jgi:hypothetical protein